MNAQDMLVNRNTHDTTIVDRFNLATETNDSLLYEDDTYLVWRTCAGEFGGNAWFKNKRTGTITGCEAQCAIRVDKIENDYYVTASLSHITGSITIIKIPDPAELREKSNPTLLSKAIRRISRLFQTKKRFEPESISGQGTETLVHEFDLTIVSAFEFEDELYQVIKRSDTAEFMRALRAREEIVFPQNILLTRLDGNELSVVDTIIPRFYYDTPIYYESQNRMLNHTHQICSLVEEKYTHYIEIKEGEIQVLRMEREEME